MARSASKIKPTSPSSSSISFGLPSGGIYYRLCEHQLSRARNLESDFPGADDTAIATHRWLDSISLSLSLSRRLSTWKRDGGGNELPLIRWPRFSSERSEIRVASSSQSIRGWSGALA